MSFNAVGFVRGLKGNDSFGRELNGLESVVGSHVEEVLRRCAAGSQRWRCGLRCSAGGTRLGFRVAAAVLLNEEDNKGGFWILRF
jgi:hypothetical protein